MTAGRLMTEAEWSTATEPTLMLESLQDRTDVRKLRLFMCACCDRIAHFLAHDCSRAAIRVLERHADGLASDEQVIAAASAVEEILGLSGGPGDAAACAVSCAIGVPIEGPSAVGSVGSADGVVRWATCAVTGIPPRHKKLTRAQTVARAVEARSQADLARDIFGNPFRPVSVLPAWRSDTTVALSRRMYEARDFGALPILADALQDAGCDNADILDHCRGAGPHVRGCWVVDLVLYPARSSVGPNRSDGPPTE
jgi:hypothetical protein